MTSQTAIKSASFALAAFLRDKPEGYEFTVETLQEDFLTSPDTAYKLARGAVSGFVSRNYARGAFTRRRAAAGKVRWYKLADKDALAASNRRGIGGAKGRHHKPHKIHPDSPEAPAPGMGKPAPIEIAAGLPQPGAISWQPAAGYGSPPPRINQDALRETALAHQTATLDGTIELIRRSLLLHIDAIEAKRPAPAFPDAPACAAKHGADLLQHISLDALLEEVRRRAAHA